MGMPQFTLLYLSLNFPEWSWWKSLVRSDEINLISEIIGCQKLEQQQYMKMKKKIKKYFSSDTTQYNIT